MNGTTRSRVTSAAFHAPTSAPVATAAPMAHAGEPPSRSTTAVTTPARAMTDPTERSMPPLTMMKVIPMAPRPTMSVWARMTRRFWSDR